MQGRCRYAFLILASCVPILSACGSPEALTFKAVTVGISAATNGFFLDPDVNLKEKNYAAADYLAGKMNGFVSKYDVVLAQPLEEVDHAGISSPLGASIPEGIGLRFAELGYGVQLYQVAAGGNAGLYPMPEEAPDLVLRGTYSVERDRVDVFLRVMHIKSGKVVAQFDYALPLSKEVREMSKTQTRIFRVSQ